MVYRNSRNEAVTQMDMNPINRDEIKESDALYVQVVERIRQWILTGHLKDGDMLPSERDLAKIFDVSRVPVREALKVLEFLGAVQHIRGKGVYVRKIGIQQLLRNIDFLMVSPKQLLAELYETRQGLESEAAILAAQRRSEQDLLDMEGAIFEMEKVIALSGDAGAASIHFHTALIKASHNEILIRINEMLRDLLEFSRRRSLQKPSRYEGVLKDHRFILEKIRQRDGEGAAKALRKHLEVAKDVVFVYETEKS